MEIRLTSAFMCSAMTWSKWLSMGSGSYSSFLRYSLLGLWHRSTARPLVSSRGLKGDVFEERRGRSKGEGGGGGEVGGDA